MTVPVLCAGVAVKDHIYYVEQLPTADGKFVAHSLERSGGGMAANAAVAVAALGGAASWMGRVGTDDLGTEILAGLAAANVDVARARRIPGAISSHSIVLVDGQGNRAIILYRPDPPAGDIDWIDAKALRGNRAVLADIRWIDGAIKALSAARDAGLPAVLDADISAHPRALSAVQAASHAIFSASGLARLFGTDDPEEGLRRAAAHAPFVAVTLGAKGVAWLDTTGAVRAIPAIPVTAVETLGAGDVFHGAFTLALAEGQSEAEALRFASAAAALKCARKGARSSYPSRNEVELCLKENS